MSYGYCPLLPDCFPKAILTITMNVESLVLLHPNYHYVYLKVGVRGGVGGLAVDLLTVVLGET